jgi:hypothetical protein
MWVKRKRVRKSYAQHDRILAYQNWRTGMRRRAAWRRMLHESRTTLLLGVLSTILGIVTLSVTIVGMRTAVKRESADAERRVAMANSKSRGPSNKSEAHPTSVETEAPLLESVTIEHPLVAKHGPRARVLDKTGKTTQNIKLHPTVTIWIPTRFAVGLALAGDILGAGGLACAVRQRRLSFLCISGLMLCAAAPFIGIVYEALMILIYGW